MLVLAMQFSRGSTELVELGNGKVPARGRHRLAPDAHNKAPWPANRSSGPWGHSLETEERTNDQPHVPPGDPKIYDRTSDSDTE